MTERPDNVFTELTMMIVYIGVIVWVLTQASQYFSG